LIASALIRARYPLFGYQVIFPEEDCVLKCIQLNNACRLLFHRGNSISRQCSPIQ
jgi:hypothetical protein